MPKMPHNLLSNALHQDTIEIPVSTKEPREGVVCVVIRQIDGSVYADLWEKMLAAQSADTKAHGGLDIGERRKAREAKYEAWASVVEACAVEMGECPALFDGPGLVAREALDSFMVTLLEVINLYQFGVLTSARKIWESEAKAAPLATPPETTT